MSSIPPTADRFGGLPTWSELLRLFPVSMWSVMLIGIGYWTGRESQQPYIDTLISMVETQ